MRARSCTLRQDPTGKVKDKICACAWYPNEKGEIEYVNVDGKREIKKIKKSIVVSYGQRINIRCRSCFSVDGYTAEEKVCHNCKEKIYG